MGLEPWESSLRGTPASSEDCQNETSAAESAPAEQTPPNPTREQNTDASAAGAGAGESITTSRCSSTVLDDERLCIVRLVDCLSRGVWPTYARLACALNLLSLRAMHAHLCNWLADLLRRRDFRARAPLTARVCGAVPFLPAGGGGQAFCTGGINTLPSTPESALGRGFGTTEEASGMRGAGSAGAGGGLSAAATSSSSSSMFYSAFLHPLYVWAQCLDRQFYAQVRTVLYFFHSVALVVRFASRYLVVSFLSCSSTPILSRSATSRASVDGRDHTPGAPRFGPIVFGGVTPRLTYRTDHSIHRTPQ